MHVAPVDEGHRDAAAPRPGGPADPVQVGLLVFGALVVHHVGDVVHVESARRDLSRHEYVDLSVPERPQGAFPLALAQIAMDRRGGEPPGGQGRRHLVRGPLGPAEHHGQSPPGGLQEPGEHLDLVHLVRPEHVLLGQGHDLRLVLLLGPDVHRLAQVPPGERHNVSRHGGREQHGLPISRGELEDALHVRQEPEIEHLVRLVEDEHADPGQGEVALPDEVEQASRRPHDHVDRGAQGLDLGLVSAAAVDGQHPGALLGPGGSQVVSDLAGQFPGGHHDEGAGGGGLARRRLRELLKYRDSERERLACPGSGLADNVVASKCDGQRQRLDGEGREDSHGLQRGRDRLVYAEFTECSRDVRRTCRRGLRCGLRCRQPGDLRCQGNQLPSVARGLAAHCAHDTVRLPPHPGLALDSIGMTMHADAIRRRNRTLSHARGGKPIAAPRTGQTPRLTASVNAAGDVPHSRRSFLAQSTNAVGPAAGLPCGTPVVTLL